MKIKTLESFDLSDAVKFHYELNPKLWRNNRLDPAVKKQLLIIAKDFLTELGIKDLDVDDITISGSNAAYTYTPHSDLDLHILVDMSKLSNDEVYKELFQAKKTLYNDRHDIKIRGIPIELYVQDSKQSVISLGEYSLLQNKWLKIPTKRRANFDQRASKVKYDKLNDLVTRALRFKKSDQVNKALKIIKQYRQAGLDKGGEFSPENLAFKAIRKRGFIQDLYTLRDELHSKELSIENMYAQKVDPTYNVNETFDKPYKILRWEKGDYGDVDAIARLDDNTFLSIMFNKGYSQGTKEEAWSVEFHRNNSQEVTGEGDAQRVFATVLGAIQTFIKKYKPNRVIFSASKEVEPGQKSQSRANLYDRLVQRYAKSWGFKAFRADTGNKVHYELSRINKGVAEARTNPEQNPKPESGMKELASIAKTINDPQNWAISMTIEPKLGINPQVGISEDTPKGIYFYPLNYALDKTRYGKLPWGDNYPYIQLFQYDRSNEMTKKTKVDPNKLKQALLQYCPEEVIQEAIDDPEYDGTPYWFIYDCLSRLGESDETNVVRWNKVLRDLGFTSVFDPGDGWIAYNEPTQGVVLDARIIKQQKTITNKQQSKVVTPAKIERVIFDTLDIELASNRAWQKYDPNGSKLRAAAKEYAKKPEFKPYYGKPGSEEIFDKAEGWGRYGASQLRQEAYEWFKEQQGQPKVNEASGYIPSEKEKNDPRFKTALTVDVKPDSIKKNAKAFGSNIQRSGIPPTLPTNGKRV